MRNLMKKTFRTQDTRGCEFYATGYYERIEFSRKFRGTLFTAMGYQAKTLKELKIIIGNLP